ncbi:hypothetical protein BST61_g7386 [Cercospora zeina]
MEDIAESQLDELKKICPTYYIRGQPEYQEQKKPWSIAANRNPTLNVVKHLYSSILDFAIRSTGTGSSSAHDVILSTQGFKSFEFDPGTEIATVGAGISWGEVDKLVDFHAPGYGAVAARCPWVGVAGCPMAGGFSWLSHEHGLVSDPQNLIDAQVVLRDGRVVWAKADGEDDLVWGLRGGGGNFGVVSALKFHLKRVSSKIFAAMITVPYSSLVETSEATAAMHRRATDPKIAMFVANQGPGMGQPSQGARPGIVITAIDIHGEAHARSEEGFAWAYKLSGAVEVAAGEMGLQQVNNLSAGYGAWQGTSRYRCAAPLISKVDDDFIVRLWQWFEDTYKVHPGFEVGSAIIFELMQEAVFNSVPSPASTVALVTTPKDTSEDVENKASTQLQKLGDQITAGKGFHGEYFTAFLYEWNYMRQVLVEVKQKYDPDDRFNKGIDVGSQRVSKGMTV